MVFVVVLVYVVCQFDDVRLQVLRGVGGWRTGAGSVGVAEHIAYSNYKRLCAIQDNN